MKQHWNDKVETPPNGETPDLTLKNLSVLNKRVVVSLFFVTDDKQMWIFPNASYDAQKVADLEDYDSNPAAFRLEFKDNQGQEWAVTLRAGPDKDAFGIVLVKFAAGILGMIRPGRADVASITLEDRWAD